MELSTISRSKQRTKRNALLLKEKIFTVGGISLLVWPTFPGLWSGRLGHNRASARRVLSPLDSALWNSCGNGKSTPSSEVTHA